MQGQPLEPNYTVEQAVKMLPYVQSYCKDIRRAHEQTSKYAALGYRINSMIALSDDLQSKIDCVKDSVLNRIESNQRNMIRWYEELFAMRMLICCTRIGAIDVPVYVDDLGKVVYLCVTPDTTEENIEWHSVDEGNDKARHFAWMPVTQTD